MSVSRREFLQAGAMVMAGAGTGAGARAAGQSSPPSPAVKALVFDTFGTVVDWRSSVAREVEALATRKGVAIDGPKFADAWRAGYGPSMNRVRRGELPWTKLDALHRMTLDRIPCHGQISVRRRRDGPGDRVGEGRLCGRMLPIVDADGDMAHVLNQLHVKNQRATGR